MIASILDKIDELYFRFTIWITGKELTVAGITLHWQYEYDCGLCNWRGLATRMESHARLMHPELFVGEEDDE